MNNCKGNEMDEFDATQYSIVVTKVHEDDEHLYFAYVKEVPDISSYSESFQDAYDDCIDAINVLYADAMENGKKFPRPYRAPAPTSPSGRVTLRMSRSMHADIVRCADEDGVSLNQWIIEAIAQRRGFYIGTKSPTTFASMLSSGLPPFLRISTSNTRRMPPEKELKLSSTDELRYVSL